MGVIDSFKDSLNGFVDGWKDHPLQQIAKFGATMAGGPAVGMAVGKGFEWRNNGVARDQTANRQQANIDAMDAKLFDGFSGPGGSATSSYGPLSGGYSLPPSSQPQTQPMADPLGLVPDYSVGNGSGFVSKGAMREANADSGGAGAFAPGHDMPGGGYYGGGLVDSFNGASNKMVGDFSAANSGDANGRVRYKKVSREG